MTTFARLLLAALIFVAPQSALAGDREPAEVMLFGVFHFSNPGLDVVKTEQIDVMTPDNQAYLEGLARRISEYNPTRILLEFEPSRAAEMQARYRAYLDGSFELTANENYQLGFRIAALSAAETVHGFDDRSVEWDFGSLMAYMEARDPETMVLVGARIKEVTSRMTEAHRTMTLKELLLMGNTAADERENRGIYVMTNHVGDAENYIGADLAAAWWHRNFRMYANIQRHAQPGERVLVIAGSGHTAILSQLLADDVAREAVDAIPYL